MLHLFTFAIFVSAALLFAVQPMVGKMVLPTLGGSPSVWNTCMVFFQAVLLLGYFYAYLVRKLPVKGQIVLHSLILLAAGVLLPISKLPVSSEELGNTLQEGGLQLSLWLCVYLAKMAGGPFFVLSSTAPLLQSWFSRTDHQSAKDPYFLYVASNAGSVLGLIAYPFVIEPLLGVSRQGQWWSVGYGVLALLLIGAGAACWKRLRANSHHPVTAEAAPTAAAPTMRDRLLWVLLAAVPSSLSLGCTQYMSTDIAAVPLLWVLPLLLYLVSFIIAFGKNPKLMVWAKLAPIAALLVAIPIVTYAKTPTIPIVGIHLGALLILATVCHGRLASMRPGAAYLTEFYLWMSIGGLLGGIFNSLIAPVIFPAVLEYQLAIVAAVLLRPRSFSSKVEIDARQLTLNKSRLKRSLIAAGIYLVGVIGGRLVGRAISGIPAEILFFVGVLVVACVYFVWPSDSYSSTQIVPDPAKLQPDNHLRNEQPQNDELALRRLIFDLACVLAIGGYLYGINTYLNSTKTKYDPTSVQMLQAGIPAVACILMLLGTSRFGEGTRRFALSLGAMLLAGFAQMIFAGGNLLHIERTFFGVHRVFTDRQNAWHTLLHGTTKHGVQAVYKGAPLMPTTYYHPTGPIGQILQEDKLESRFKHIAAIGLGAGSIAAYNENGCEMTFYEIDPAVVAIAQHKDFFTFLQPENVRGTINFSVGDGRLNMNQAKDGQYGLIILDAFSSDAIPVHLLTREAIELYLSKLQPDGIIAMHISNLYFDLEPVVRRLASEAGCVSYIRHDTVVGKAQTETAKAPSVWVVMARTREALGPLGYDARWVKMNSRPTDPLWTDDYANVLGVMTLWQGESESRP